MAVICGSVDNPTDEDVIPKWLLRAFHAQAGSIIVSVAEEYGELHRLFKPAEPLVIAFLTPGRRQA